MQLTGTRRTLQRRIEALRRESVTGRSAEDARLREAISTPYLWATEYTQTYNEHWVEEGRPSPYEPFPQRLPYLEPLFQMFDLERILWIVKSRDMMISWACLAYLTWKAMSTPLCGSVVQAQKEKKVIQLIDYAKCLYRRQPAWLRDAFPLAKPLKNQSDLELEFANGSYIVGIPGGADQIRSYHPWGYLNDESSFQPEAGDCYNEALSVVKGKIIFNSSAGPGWYADARRDVVRSEEE
jgi:hypothetical protein